VICTKHAALNEVEGHVKTSACARLFEFETVEFAMHCTQTHTMTRVAHSVELESCGYAWTYCAKHKKAHFYRKHEARLRETALSAQRLPKKQKVPKRRIAGSTSSYIFKRNVHDAWTRHRMTIMLAT
jgi:hypothetical protein